MLQIQLIEDMLEITKIERHLLNKKNKTKEKKCC